MGELNGKLNKSQNDCNELFSLFSKCERLSLSLHILNLESREHVLRVETFMNTLRQSLIDLNNNEEIQKNWKLYYIENCNILNLFINTLNSGKPLQ